MFAFTIIGFIVESGKYLDFAFEVLADSPVEAMELARVKDERAVISSVVRKADGTYRDI